MKNSFTTAIISMNTLQISATTTITGNRIGVYADQLTINGVLNATGLGCAAGEGQGAGLPANDNCTASGGAHGGVSGKPINYSSRQRNVDDKELSRFSINLEVDPYNDLPC